MARLPRPTLHWLLWLVIALLPLRGWAQAQMVAQGGPAAEWRVAEPGAAPVLADPMPAHCHEAPAMEAPESSASTQADADSATAQDEQGDHAGHPGCSLCGVCHASVGLAMPGFELNLPTLPGAVPAATPPSGLADGPPTELFRPPRRRA